MFHIFNFVQQCIQISTRINSSMYIRTSSFVSFAMYPIFNTVLHFYRQQTKFAKVMFLQVCVCPHGGHAWLLGGVWLLPEWGCVWLLWGACMVALGCMCGCFGGVHHCSGGVCVVAPRGHAWLLLGGVWLLWGACIVAPGGGVWLLQGACIVAPGGHVWLLPGGVCMGYDEIWRYDQWAGSTHPTGMHSC